MEEADVLRTAGFRLPSFAYGFPWRNAVEFLQQAFCSMAYIARGTVTIAGRPTAPSPSATVEWVIEGRAVTCAYEPPLIKKALRVVLPMILRDLNRELVSVCEERFMLVKQRVLFVDRGWQAVARRSPDYEDECLDPADVAALAEAPAPTTLPPRLEIADLIGAGNELVVDCECGSRPEMLIALIEQLARFIGVEVTVDPDVPHRSHYTVRHAGVPTTLVLDDERIPEIGPIVRYLISHRSGLRVGFLLAPRPHQRLVLASPAQILELIDAGLMAPADFQMGSS